MKVSLITVCFNSVNTIKDTLSSALSQQGVELQYIVVDGGSKDGTVEAIREFAGRNPGRIEWVSEPDCGMYDALNKGIARSTGEIVGCLNSDDVFENEHVLATVVSSFADDVDGIYADVRFVSGQRTFRYYSARHWKPWMHRWGFMPPHPSVYLRRSLFERFGNYRVDYRISADFELMTRFFCHEDVRLRYIPNCLVVMRLGGLSTSGLRAMWLLNRENVRANRENGFFCCMPMMLPKYFYKLMGVVRRKIR